MSSRRVIALAVIAGAFGSLDTSLNIAFPDLVEDFDLALADLQWVVVCFVLSSGALLLVAGQLGDSVGHRHVAAIGGLVSGVGLLGCALAPNFAGLLVARGVQGVGLALVMASAPALLTLATRSTEGASRGVGIFQTSASVGLAIGPVAGGPLVELVGWRGVFWFRVPLAIVLVVVALTAGSPRTEADQELEGPQGTTDRIGMTLVAVCMGSLVMALNLGGTFGWLHPLVVGGFVVAAGCGYGFVISSRRAEVPMLDSDLFRSTPFSVAITLSIVAHAAMFATWLFVPSLLVDSLAVSVVVGGVVLAASPIATAVASMRVASLVPSVGAWRLMAIGLMIEGAGMAGFGLVGDSWSPWMIGVLLALVGVGLGIFTVPNMTVVMDALPPSKQGVGGGLSLMTRTIGIVAGVAIVSALFNRLEVASGFFAAFHFVFAGSGVILAVAGIAVALLRFDRVSCPGSELG